MSTEKGVYILLGRGKKNSKYNTKLKCQMRNAECYKH